MKTKTRPTPEPPKGPSLHDILEWPSLPPPDLRPETRWRNWEQKTPRQRDRLITKALEEIAFHHRVSVRMEALRVPMLRAVAAARRKAAGKSKKPPA